MFYADSLFAPRSGRPRRFSSHDPTGGNRDFWSLEPGERRALAEFEGAGVVRHIWMTIGHPDRLYLRNMVLRAWWDDERSPSIEAPIGDFFCLGQGIARTFQNAAFSCVTHKDNEGNLGGGVALNCWLPMPFRRAMRIEVENQSDQPCGHFYFYVDFEESLEAGALADALYFHAQYRQECPTETGQPLLAEQGVNYWDRLDTPVDPAENYVILEAVGRGHYVGCNLSVHNLDPALFQKPFGDALLKVPELTWWGEGDDMIYIDGEAHPSLYGTGSEDYFTQAWGMHDHAQLFGGTTVNEHDPRHPNRRACTSYRLHLLDPIAFRESIRVTIEHGHANLQKNDYSSVAYWYQSEPHAEFPELPPRDARIPRFAAEELDR